MASLLQVSTSGFEKPGVNGKANMKKRRSTKTTNEPQEPVQQHTPGQHEEEQGGESADLSPKRIRDGVSTRTKLLDGILAGPGQKYRHWGINE